MSTIGNSPTQSTLLRLEARKSFSLGLHFVDPDKQPVNITTSQIRLVSKRRPFGSNDSNNLVLNGEATLVNPTLGYARIDLQAVDLDWPAGTYPFVIVLVNEGYSSVIVKGELDIQDNPEAESLEDEYTTSIPPTNLQIKLRGRFAIEVTVGHALPPGTHSYTTADRDKLAGIEAGAQVNTLDRPGGGFPGNFLALGNGGEVQWVASPGGGGGGLDATGVPDGWVPTANGANNWSWEEILAEVISINGQQGIVSMDLDDIPDGSTRLALTPAERTLIDDLDSAAFQPSSSFLPSSGIDADKTISGVFDNARIPIVTALRGISVGEGEPTGGTAGDLYIQLEEE